MPASTPFIGVISDTHGLVREETVAHLAGAELIIHAGDFGGDQVLKSLRKIGKLMVIRGNVDFDRSVPETDMFEFRGKTFYMLHDLESIDISPSAAEVDFVISGHTHRPKLINKNGIQYLNPGSCGPPRPGTPVSMAKIFPEQDWRIEFINMDIQSCD